MSAAGAVQFFRNSSRTRLASARMARMMLNVREERPCLGRRRLGVFCSTGCAVTAFSRTGLERVPGTACRGVMRGCGLGSTEHRSEASHTELARYRSERSLHSHIHAPAGEEV